MPNFRLFGRIYYPAAIRVKAISENKALIRAAFGDFDVIDKLGKPRFEMDFESEPEELQEHEKPRRFRVIFRETTQYAVEFYSSRSLRDLLNGDEWRDELDRYATALQLNWQQENAIGVDETVLEHLEELGKGGEALALEAPRNGSLKINLIATGICTCGHARRDHALDDGCYKCGCEGFREKEKR